MANSSISLPRSLACFSQALESFCLRLPKESSVCVAFSGGLDSTVLLHLLSQSDDLKGRIWAHYIDHGLQAASLGWSQHCSLVCDQFGVSFRSSSVEVVSYKRQGVESAARVLRYQTLAEGLNDCKEVLVTGHHQRDQAETVLLNLVRGAGVSGLSAMPYEKTINLEGFQSEHPVKHLRPLLAIPYDRLVEYARFFDLNWIEDPSNQELSYKRNVIRQTILPALKSHWNGVDKILARTAEHMSEASVLLNRMAQTTLKNGGATECYIDLGNFQALDWLELKNLIRYWFSQVSGGSLSTAHYTWISSVLRVDGVSRQSNFSYQLSSGRLTFHKKRLYFLPKEAQAYSISLTRFIDALKLETQIADPKKPLPSLTAFQLRLPRHLLINNEGYSVRNISQLDEIKRKKLKAFFQEAQVPVWERPWWPVLVFQGKVVSVLGCSMDCSNPVFDKDSEIEMSTICVPQSLIWKIMGLR